MKISRSPAALRLALALAFAVAGPAGAQEPPVELGPETNLPLPRYVSLRAGEVNVRRGPGLDYRIDWVFQRSGLPVRVIDEYGHWRRIADSDDAGGWVYHALLTGRRMALVTAPEVTSGPSPSAPRRQPRGPSRGSWPTCCNAAPSGAGSRPRAARAGSPRARSGAWRRTRSSAADARERRGAGTAGRAGTGCARGV